MPAIRLGPGALNKAIQSGGGATFGLPREWMTGAYGSGYPVAPVSMPADVAIPREFDYPMSVNSTITPRTGYGLAPFSALKEVYENVSEVRIPVSLIARELSSFSPALVDQDGNKVEDHPYAWMAKHPDGVTPFGVWMTRFLKSTKVYDAPAIYLEQANDGTIKGMHYVDGSTLFLIIDDKGNTPSFTENKNNPQAESLESYAAKLSKTADPKTFQKFMSSWMTARRNSKGPAPEYVPAYAQIIKGTPFSWWNADQVWYKPQSRRMDAPYGESFIETAWSWIMIIVNIVAFELGHYKTGNMPEGFVTLPQGMFSTMDRVLLAEAMFNARMSSNPATERMRLRMFPDGTKYFATKKPDFPGPLYKQAFDIILHSIGVPPSELGDVPGQGLGGKGFKEGAVTDLGRNILYPTRDFIVAPFNDILDRDGVDDVRMTLDYPMDETDPDKQRQAVYDGMAHGTLTLNDGMAQLDMLPVGDPDNPDNLANKHLIVAGQSIYVIEDMQVSDTGMALPSFSPADANQAGGAPVDPETAVKQSGAEHTPEDNKTLIAAIQRIMDGKTPESKVISIPSGKVFKRAIEGGEPALALGLPTSDAMNAGAPLSGPVLGKADATHSDGAMIAVFIPSEAAKQLRGITEQVGFPSEAQLETPNNMHVTLAFLPDQPAAMNNRSAILDSMAKLAADTAPLDGKIQGFGVFNGQDGMKVLFALLDEPQLPFVRTSICNALDESGIAYGKDYGFVPHITLAYFPESFELPAGFEVPNIPTKIDSLSLAFGLDITNVTLGASLGKGQPLDKHCGVCPEDEDYFGAPIDREVQFTFPDPHHANGVEIVAMAPDGLPPKAALWKPEGGEDSSLQEYVGGPQYVREEAAYLLDRSLGFMLVPVAYVAEANDELGAAVYYTHDMAQGYGDVTEYGMDWIIKAAVLDYIASQIDRGYKHNHGVHPDDPTRPVLFDNGLAFPESPDLYCSSPFCDAAIGIPLPDDVLRAIKVCLADVATWQDIARLVGPVSAAKAQACAQRLLDNGMITHYSSTEMSGATNGSGGL